MQDLIFFYESASLDVKLQDKKFIHPFFHLFVCFFDRSCNSIVHVYLMRMFKTHVTCRSSGRVSGCQTKRPYVFFFLLQRSCSNCVDAHAHADVELCLSYALVDTVTYFMWVFFYCIDPMWKGERVPDKTAIRVFFPVAKILLKLCRCTCTCWCGTVGLSGTVGHMFSWTPSHISCESFSTVNTQRHWSDCADAHACICWSKNFAGKMFLGHHFIFHSFFTEILTRPFISLTFIYCKDPDQTELWNIFDTTFHLR